MDEARGVDPVEYGADEPTIEGKVAHFHAPGASGAMEAYLTVLVGSQIGEMVQVKQGLVVGRAPSLGLTLKDAGVSKRHFGITVDAQGGASAEDLGSRNGTFVNGEPLEASRPLQDGDKIRVGETTVLRFSLADSLEASFQQHLQQAAIRDSLTGLYNRGHLIGRLECEVSYVRRHRVALSLIVLKIDQFEQVNRSYGQAVGNDVLKKIGRCIDGAIRKEDVAARFGGVTVAVICRGTAMGMAATVAERLRRTLAAERFVRETPEHVITLSAGVAGMPGGAIDDAPSLIDAAERALQRARRVGVDCVRCFDAELDGRVGSRQNTAERVY